MVYGMDTGSHDVWNKKYTKIVINTTNPDFCDKDKPELFSSKGSIISDFALLNNIV